MMSRSDGNDTFRAVFREDLARARAHRDGDDPWPVLEALSRALFASAAGELDELGRGELEPLVRAGRRALLAAGPAPDGEDDEDAADAIALARAGLAVLSGEPPARVYGPRDPMHVPDGRLAAAARGALDGFSLGALALHVVRCEPCSARLGVLGAGGRAALHAPLRVAARSAVPMRRPDEGHVVISLDDPAVEVVLFDDGDGARSLAVYAEQPVSVRLVAPSIETLDMLTGYFLGRLTGDAPATLDAELHHGERTTRVTIAL
jgi:hypothetical protein